MLFTILLLIQRPGEINLSSGYLAVTFIAFLILGYLVYSLIKPEKF
jgi:K+-transporting ATPase KdpF subunit